MMHPVQKSLASVNLNSNYIEAPFESNFDFDQNDDWSISFWIYSIGAVAAPMIMHQSGTTLTGAGWNIFCDSSARYEIRYVDGAGGSARFRIAARAQNTWNHYVFTKAGGNPNTASLSRSWLNGARNGLTTVATTYNTALSMLNNDGLRIGGYTANYTNTMNIRDIQFYDRVLDQYEVRELYNAGRNTFSPVYSKGLIPTAHFIYDPSMYKQPSGSSTTIFLRNEKTKEYNVSGNLVLESRVNTTIGTTAPQISYEKGGRSMSYKNLFNYVQGNENDVYNTLYKNTGGGANYSRAASIKKIVGNGKVKFRNLVSATTARITFMCLHDKNTLPTNPSTAVLTAGWGNQSTSMGRQFIESGTTTNSNATANNGETCELEVNFDTDVITAKYYLANSLITTFTSVNSASTLFPSREWYLCPLTLVDNNDSTYQQVYYISLDMSVDNSGIIEDNNLI